MFEIRYRLDNGKLVPTTEPCLLERLDRAGYEAAYGGEPIARPANVEPHAYLPDGYQFWKNERGEIRAILDSGTLTQQEFHAARKA